MRYIYIILTLLFITSVIRSQEPPPSDAAYFVAPWGNDSNTGLDTANAFATLAKAIDVAYPGDTVYLRGGIWYPTAPISINPENYGDSLGRTGTAEAPICYFNYPGEHAIFDFVNYLNASHTSFSGITVSHVQYIKFKGITVRNLKQTFSDNMPQGWAGSWCANITWENCKAHDIGGRGWNYYSGAWNEWDGAGAEWEYDTTRWINCDAYNLIDSLSSSAGNAADGWKTHNYQTNYYSWDGCRAWNYTDDGVDPSGEGYKMFNNCWFMAFSHTYEEEEWDMEMTGIKIFAPRRIYWNGDTLYRPELLGADTILVRVTNCIFAYCNTGLGNNVGMDGINFWSNNALIYNNSIYKTVIGIVDGAGSGQSKPRTAVYRNNIIASSVGTSFYAQTQIYYPSIYPESHNTWDATQDNGWPGWTLTDTVTVTDADFVSTDSTQLIGSRQSDGSLPEITFLKLAETSDLIDAGTDWISELYTIPGSAFTGTAPDMGYAEFGLEEGTTPYVSSQSVSWKNINSGIARGTVTNDGGNTVTARGIVWATTTTPDLTDNVVTVSGTTGAFTATITGLSPNTLYYVRAYATNSEGTSYGEQISFTTSAFSRGKATGKVIVNNGKIIIVR